MVFSIRGLCLRPGFSVRTLSGAGDRGSSPGWIAGLAVALGLSVTPNLYRATRLARSQRSPPPQPCHDRASHHPVLVALRQEAQLLGDVGDALAVACLGERVRDVGGPMAA